MNRQNSDISVILPPTFLSVAGKGFFHGCLTFLLSVFCFRNRTHSAGDHTGIPHFFGLHLTFFPVHTHTVRKGFVASDKWPHNNLHTLWSIICRYVRCTDWWVLCNLYDLFCIQSFFFLLSSNRTPWLI